MLSSFTFIFLIDHRKNNFVSVPVIHWFEGSGKRFAFVWSARKWKNYAGE